MGCALSRSRSDRWSKTTVGAALPEHEYFCGNSGGETRQTQKSIPATDSNVLIVIKTDSQGTVKVLPVKF
ncbi:hypothetical protein GW16_14815 [Xanthomonas arboricola pv. celebensis]|nr:hypothetical protein GW16_14815 [Xanthomonas arboricola pv. celebensis]